ncbi:MAG: SDR family NAD(P)-dependent oxidoreductase [Naasia sp.]
MTDSPRTVLVTGAASGIGRAVAAGLASAGYRVIALDRDPSVGEVAAEIDAVAVVADIADETGLAAALADVSALAPDSSESLDALVNAAGIGDAFPVEGDLAVYRRVLEVNLTGALLVTRAVLPALRRSTAPRILNIGSIQASHAGGDSVAYSASKGALHSATRALAVDLASDGILVNALAPGFISTPMSVLPDGKYEFETDWFRQVYVDNARIPLRRPGTADEVAAAAEFFVSPRNTYVTGAVLAVDGGMTATF